MIVVPEDKKVFAMFLRFTTDVLCGTIFGIILDFGTDKLCDFIAKRKKKAREE